jgi:hypothetical protein
MPLRALFFCYCPSSSQASILPWLFLHQETLFIIELPWNANHKIDLFHLLDAFWPLKLKVISNFKLCQNFNFYFKVWMIGYFGSISSDTSPFTGFWSPKYST